MDVTFIDVPDKSYAALDGCKYVVGERSGEEVMLVFGNNLLHIEVAKDYLPGCRIASAGFVRMGALRNADDNGDYTVGYVCFGSSMSLMKRARPEIDGPALTAYVEASTIPDHQRFLV